MIKYYLTILLIINALLYINRITEMYYILPFLISTFLLLLQNKKYLNIIIIYDDFKEVETNAAKL